MRILKIYSNLDKYIANKSKYISTTLILRLSTLLPHLSIFQLHLNTLVLHLSILLHLSTLKRNYWVEPANASKSIGVSPLPTSSSTMRRRATGSISWGSEVIQSTSRIELIGRPSCIMIGEVVPKWGLRGGIWWVSERVSGRNKMAVIWQ